MSCTIYRVITLRQAIEAAEVSVLDGKEDIRQECSWSWSADGICWSPWAAYRDFLRITPLLESDFYLRIRSSRKIDAVLVGGCLINDWSMSLDQTNIFLQDFCSSPSLFQPYQGMDCALLLQKQLADQVVCIFGIPIYYVVVDPDADSADYTFKEYVLHGVKDIKQIKLMLEDGRLPSSNPTLGELDFTWESDWGVELSKTQFGKAFGDTAFPKRRDLVWVPMMKRLWMVNSAYDEKAEGLLYRSTTWKLSLIKYTEDTAIDQGGFEGIIDSWTKNKYDELFHWREMEEVSREGGADPLDTPDHAATNTYPAFLEDSVRASFTPDYINIYDKQYLHLSTVAARNVYSASSDQGLITYQRPICSPDGTITMIIETGSLKEDVGWRAVMRAGEVAVEANYDQAQGSYDLRLGAMEASLRPLSVYIAIITWQKATRSAAMSIFQQINANTRRPSFDFERPVYEGTDLYNEDWDIRGPHQIALSPWPLMLTGIKVYEEALGWEASLKESIKYLTTRPSCLVNDQARPLDLGHGYSIR